MPTIRGHHGIWASVGRATFLIRRTAARLLGSLLILVIWGCAATTTPPATDEPRALTEKSDLPLAAPFKGPIGATVTLTVFEDYQ